MLAAGYFFDASIIVPHAVVWVPAPNRPVRENAPGKLSAVWMIFSGDHQVRRVYLDVPHSEQPTPSWYGESVGHYEGDTFVIDTIGQNDKTVLDAYRTPHTKKLHVVERWRLIDDGKAMQVTFTVDDPDAFNQPWSGMRRYRRVQDQLAEDVCAENNQHLFDWPMLGCKSGEKPLNTLFQKCLFCLENNVGLSHL
jgi:hypothetical protein